MEWEAEAQEELQQLSVQTREEVLQHLLKLGGLPGLQQTSDGKNGGNQLLCELSGVCNLETHGMKPC